MKQKNLPTVPTIALFGYLSVVLSWELQIGFLALHLLTEQKPGIWSQAILLAVSLSLSAFVSLRGRRDFKALFMTRGRIELNGLQAMLVTAFMILFGSILTFVAIGFFDG